VKGIISNLYINSPYIVKRLFANLEAIRRDKYRKSEYIEYFDFRDVVMGSQPYYDVEKVARFIQEAANNVSYYKFLKGYTVYSEKEFEKIPLLTKEIVRENSETLISKNVVNITQQLWKGSSSGSTGMPLKYYRDKRSVTIERKQYDDFYSYCGCDTNDKSVRISGVKVAPFNKKTPPYWVYIDRYKQLQSSAYHISKETYKDYIKAFKKIKPTYATGFPSGWAALAEAMNEEGVVYKGLKAIITDSEGLSLEKKEKIEKAFACPVYQTYGLGEVGMCSVQCENGNYHVLPSHYVEVVSENGDRVEDGNIGEIVVTDFNSSNSPFIRYATGDMGIMYRTPCGCKLKTPYLSNIVGRIEDYILTKDNRKVTRVTQLLKPAIGINESQIIQVSRDEIVINVIPSDNFDKESMKLVVKKAKEFVGDINVSWRVVDNLERMPSGKLKFLIRKF